MKDKLLRDLAIGGRFYHRKPLNLRLASKSWLLFIFFALLQFYGIAHLRDAEAGFASQASLSLGEEYSDNIFFEKKKEHDFITTIRPTFSILYAPFGQTAPIFTADLAPGGQIFAGHPNDSNFGKNTTFNAQYTHSYSPLLVFHIMDTLRYLGPARSGSSGSERRSILPPPGGATGGPPSLPRFGDFVSNGSEISNEFSTRGAYTYSPNVSFTGDYAFGYKNYLDRGSDIWHRVAARGVYRWRDEHNLHLGYGVDIIKTRNGDNNIIHHIDIGDDYFSSLKLHLNLDPTLTVMALSGIGIATGSGGVRLANTTNVSITKLWQTATLTVGVNRGITPSLGVAGISDTTSFFTNGNIRFTELLSAFINSDFSFFDTKTGKFKTFAASAGARYRILGWLSSELRYTHRWEDDAASAATSNNFVQRGKINTNSIALNLTANFDIWPSTGFARGPASP